MPENFSEILKEIRDENIKDWGRKFEKIGDFLARKLYSDRTHFIYELLQNAEDAFERANIQGIKARFKVEFYLFNDRLEVRHNGIPFDVNDVKGVCSILEGTKSEDSTQIGKFGIGFKSVYAFTKSPQIFSDDKTFQIDKYVQPVFLEPRKDVKKGETLIVLLFNNEQVSKEKAYSEIERRLKNLGIQTPLFLKNTSEILWKINNSTGAYKKEINHSDESKFVKLLYYENAEIQDEENWIVFERSLDKMPKNKVEIAFFFQEDKDPDKKQIVDVSDTFAVAYFPTSIKTNLNFLIQAPFNTTPARDNIRDDDEWNKYFIQELGILTAESISKIKKLKMLDYHFLQTLPLDSSLFEQNNSIFSPIFQKVKEKLSGNEPLLPTYGGGFTVASNALLANSEELRELLKSDQLCLLLERDHAIWLDENITDYRTRELKRYLMEDLDIDEIDSERVARDFSKEFIEKQKDKWVVQFYSYLNNQEALWRKGQYGKPDGPLRLKPFIRCEDGTHVPPFKPNNDPNIYLPSKFDNLFPIVKKTLVKDENSKEFLEKLGLKEPDKIDGIIERILPLYSNEKSLDIPEKEHLNHVEWIAKTMSEIGNPSPTQENARKIELISKVKSTAFLYGRNNVSSEIHLKRPSELYLGKPFLENDECEIFFEENPKIWFLDERYCNNDSINTNSLELMGCKSGIQVNFRKPWKNNNNVRLEDWHGHHIQGLSGFDPDCNIEGLKFCLTSINEKKSRIIWNLLKLHYNQISGIVESSKYQDFKNSDTVIKYSNMGELLITHPWLPSKDGLFYKPAEIQLLDLLDNYDIQSSEANRIADKLGFKKDLEPPIYDSNPELRKFKSVIDAYSSLSDENKKIIEEMMKKLNEPEIKKSQTSKKDIEEILKKTLVRDGDSETDTDTTSLKPNLTPDEEKTIRENFGEGFLTRLKRVKIAIQTKIQRKGMIIDSIKPQTFLLDQYDGHCQLCYTKLDLGKNRKPYFETFRLIKTENKHEFTDMEFNVLCLCPNCHAQMQHGTPLDLRNIFSKASLIRDEETGSEWITEWEKEGYIVKITVAGKEKEIFYSQAHMAKFPEFEGI